MGHPIFTTPLVVRLAAVFAAFGGLLFGFEMSVSAGAMLFVKKTFNFTDHDWQFQTITSAVTVGALVGGLVVGGFSDKFGRKKTVVLANIIYLGGVVITFESNSAEVLMLGRFVTGIAIGFNSLIVPLYVSELAPPSVRGFLVTWNQMMVCVGVLLGNVVDYLISKFGDPDFELVGVEGTSWRWMYAAASPIAVLLIIAFSAGTPESPRWLVRVGQLPLAHDVLVRLRGTNFVDQEVRDIDDALRLQSGGWQELKKPHLVHALIVGVGIVFIAQMTGVNAVNFYAPTVLEKAGFNTDDSLKYNMFIGSSKVIFIFVALALMDKLGRKTLLLIGTTGMILNLLVLSSIFLLDDITQTEGWVAIICLFLYMAFFEIGLGPIGWLILSEIYPLKIRGATMSVGTGANWLFTFVVGITFPSLLHAITISGAFFMYAGIGVASLFFIWFVIPETKGTTLEEIEHLFRRRAEKYGRPNRPSEPLLKNGSWK